MLVTAVTAQQISLLAAAVMRAALVRRLGERVSHDGAEWWRFPRQDEVQGADLTRLKLSGMKMRSIAALAEADLDVAQLPNDGVIERVTRCPGSAGGRPSGCWRAAWGARTSSPRATWACARRWRAWFSEDPIWPEQRVRDAMAPFGEHANLAAHYMLHPVRRLTCM